MPGSGFSEILNQNSAAVPYLHLENGSVLWLRGTSKLNIEAINSRRPDKCCEKVPVCFAVLRMWIRIRMFLGLQDPDPLVRGADPDLKELYSN